MYVVYSYVDLNANSGLYQKLPSAFSCLSLIPSSAETKTYLWKWSKIATE